MASDSRPSRNLSLLPRTCLIFLTLSGVGCDQSTKGLARSLEGEGSVDLFAGVFGLAYAENTDTAFGLLASFLPTVGEEVRMFGLVILTTAVVGVLAFIMLRRVGTRMAQLALALVLAGALGNLIDRATQGFVVDFLTLPHWPVFNVADIWIVLDGALLAISALRRPEPS